MKALSLTQPWATLVALGEKRYETRSWKTPYRGELAIHAAKGFPKEAREACFMYEGLLSALEGAPGWWFDDDRGTFSCPRGVVLAIVRLIDCVPVESVGQGPGTYPLSEREAAFGNYSAGRFAWIFSEDVTPLETPHPARGALGLWEWDPGAPYVEREKLPNKVGPAANQGRLFS